MVNNENLRFKNSFRRVWGSIAKNEETSAFYMCYKLLAAGDAEMQKVRFFEALGKTEERTICRRRSSWRGWTKWGLICRNLLQNFANRRLNRSWQKVKRSLIVH